MEIFLFVERLFALEALSILNYTIAATTLSVVFYCMVAVGIYREFCPRRNRKVLKSKYVVYGKPIAWNLNEVPYDIEHIARKYDVLISEQYGLCSIEKTENFLFLRPFRVIEKKK